MDVITTLLEAEFDSFAAMLAAKRLYPGATLVFSGSQERALREFLRGSARRFGLRRLRTLDLGVVTRLVVVDTRRRDRIGPFAAVAARRGVEVHVYDHHPHLLENEGELERRPRQPGHGADKHHHHLPCLD